MDLQNTYNRIAGDYLQEHKNSTWWMPGADKFIELVGVGGTVLDVGCGVGIQSKYFTERGLAVTGVDLSEGMITVAKREVPVAKFDVLDIRDFPKLTELFAGVFAQAVLLHFPKKEVPQVLAILKDKIKPGGYLSVTVKERWPNEPEEETKTENKRGYPFQRFFSYYGMDEVKKYLTDLSTTIVWENIAKSSETNWIQVIARKT